MYQLPDNRDHLQAGLGASDAELAQRAADGDRAAFDALVMRHRESVLKKSRAILGSRDQAEDVAQQAFIDAFKGLRTLDDGRKFRPWLMTITRRCACRQLSRITSEPRMVEFCEMTIGPLHAPPPSPEAEEIGERVRTILAEMAWRSREVVTLHYLDGYSCQEIGERLGIPEGTVKRILHQSRNSLREKMGVAAVTRPKGDVTQMTATVTKTKGPRIMLQCTSGAIPGPVMHTKLAQSILLTANKKAMTPAQIGAQINADEQYVEQVIRPLVDECLMADMGNGRFRTNFIALEAAEWIDLKSDIPAHGAVLADALEPHISALAEAWDKTSLPEQGYSWNEGIWPTVAILLLNMALSEAVPGRGEPPARGSGLRYLAEGREYVPNEPDHWITGTMGREVTGLAYIWLWCYPPGRRTFEFEMNEWQEFIGPTLAALAGGASSAEEIVERSGLVEERVREALARAIEAGVVKKSTQGLVLTFPVLQKEDWQTIGPPASVLAHKLEDTVLAPTMSQLSEKLRAMGYGHLEEHFAIWQGFLTSSIAGEALRELLERGVLPDPGSPAPANFCLMGSR